MRWRKRTCPTFRLESVSVNCHCSENHLRQSSEQECFLWTHGFRAFTPQLLSFMLWACGEIVYHGREHVMEQSHSCHGGQEEKKERSCWGQNPPFQIMPSMTFFLQRLTFWSFRHFPAPIKLQIYMWINPCIRPVALWSNAKAPSPNTAALGTECSTYEFYRAFQIQTVTPTHYRNGMPLLYSCHLQTETMCQSHSFFLNEN